MSVLDRLTTCTKRIKRDAATLWFASRHRAVPWLAKALAVLEVAYALVRSTCFPRLRSGAGLVFRPVSFWH